MEFAKDVFYLPSISNLYIEQLLKEIEDLPGVKLNGKIINNFRYIDNTVMIAGSEEDLQKFVDIIYTKSKEYSLDMNVNKTKI